MNELVEAKAQEVTENASRFVNWAEGLVITNVYQCQEAGEGLKKIKEFMAKAEGMFDPAIKAAHEAHKRMCGLKRQVIKPLEEAEEIAKGKVALYLVETEKARQEEEARAQVALDNRAALTGETPSLVSVPAEERPEGVSTRARWVFIVEDEAAINREYMTPDVVKIRKVVNAMGVKAEATIGGIKVRQ